MRIKIIYEINLLIHWFLSVDAGSENTIGFADIFELVCKYEKKYIKICLWIKHKN